MLHFNKKGGRNEIITESIASNADYHNVNNHRLGVRGHPAFDFQPPESEEAFNWVWKLQKHQQCQRLILFWYGKKILVDPEIKSMLQQEQTSALSPQKRDVSEGETLQTAAEYFYINLIFLLVLFPKTLYDQYDRRGTDKYLFMLRVCFWKLARALFRSPSFPAHGCIPQTAD